MIQLRINAPFDFKFQMWNPFFISILFLFSSCDFHLEKVATPISVAKEISRSKELGIFVNEFTSARIDLNDTIKFEIVSAWLEYNCYSSDLDDEYKIKEMWYEEKNWKLKKDFRPLNKCHLSFLVKGDFNEKFKAYGDSWQFYYCQLFTTNDTSISNNYTYFETYGPESYDSLTSEIHLSFEYYTPSKDTMKYGNWRRFGDIILKRK